ncbi:carcinoembryonic antigen-related cell adhesion molecule 20-like [Sinocyclocheilus grahami]|uniref:carcinoembryonic antigen-related cell adhesion molecule 20-like n=1 Tax=Sinocyclocheilus grahami TaxID=75366 RepID=UPI0007AD20E5|nr:PREDICTED: carcinoembryonic antigen-related cell adhesion molecule 20-like [Sinocyclocheilus grahami]
MAKVCLTDDVIEWRFHGVLIARVNTVSDTGSDGVTVVSVTEGDSVVLHTDIPEIQKDDEILWRFRDKDVIAKIKKDEHIFSIFDNSADGIFRSRLQLNPQTGDIIISDIRNSTSGLYKVDFKKSSYTTHKSFNVTISDKLNRVHVKEGVSVILESGLTKLEGDDLLQWRFEHEDHAIAKINKTASSSSTFDVADGRFKGRLELDDQTGSLTIRKITAEHAGLYHLDITGSSHTIFKKFMVFVCDSGLSTAAVAGIVVGVLLLVVAAAFGICYRHRRYQNGKQGKKQTFCSSVEIPSVRKKYGHHMI